MKQSETKSSFTTYEHIEFAMNQLVEAEFYTKPFFKDLLAGNFSYTQLRHFAIQYSYYSRHFPRVLGAAIAAMSPIDTWWIPIADNLWDEAGRGIPERSHTHLYQTFLLSVDPTLSLDKHGLPDKPMSSCVSKAVQSFIDFFRLATPLEAMAAVGLGSEIFAGSVMGTIGRGMKHPNYSYNGHPLNVLFWDVHADEHEPHHYQLCKDILIQYNKPSDLSRMYEVGSLIARSEAQMYDSLHAEMMLL